MTVKELIDMLKHEDPNKKIVVQTDGTYYFEIESIKHDKGVRAFWSGDYKALVLYCEDQLGAVRDEDELNIDDDEDYDDEEEG